jgi:gas vesicle protein
MTCYYIERDWERETSVSNANGGTPMLQREESRHDFAFIAGVVIGAIAGAIATLALTPMSGNETREMVRSRVGDMDDLKERAQNVKVMATERASNVAHQAQPMMEKVKTQATDLAAKSPLPFGEEENGEDTVTEMTPAPAADRPTSS